MSERDVCRRGCGRYTFAKTRVCATCQNELMKLFMDMELAKEVAEHQLKQGYPVTY